MHVRLAVTGELAPLQNCSIARQLILSASKSGCFNALIKPPRATRRAAGSKRHGDEYEVEEVVGVQLERDPIVVGWKARSRRGELANRHVEDSRAVLDANVVIRDQDGGADPRIDVVIRAGMDDAQACAPRMVVGCRRTPARQLETPCVSRRLQIFVCAG